MDAVQEVIEDLSDKDSFLCSPSDCFSELRNYNSRIRIFHMNIRSLNRNHNELLVLLTEIKCTVDVIVLTECWLSKVSNVPSIPGYTSYCTNVNYNQNDGVVIYVVNNLQCEIDEPNFNEGTALVCKFQNNLAVVAIYRSPSFADTDMFINSLKVVLCSLSQCKSVAVLGDINIDIFPGNETIAAEEYLEMLAGLGYLSKHFFVTHGKTCYDHVILKSNLSSKTLVITSTITDHYSTILCLEQPITKKNFVTYKNLLDLEAALTEFQQVDFRELNCICDPNMYADILIAKVRETMQNNINTKIIRRKRTPIKPWITAGILKCIRNRDRLHLKSKNDPGNDILRVTYVRYRNYCCKLLYKLKYAYECSQFKLAGKDPKATWKTIKMVTNMPNKSIPSTELIRAADNPIASANFVNKFFGQVGELLAKDITDRCMLMRLSPRIFPDVTHSSSMALLETDEDEIDVIISSLKNDCAHGWDNISVIFVKSARVVLVPLLTQLFNLCIRTGTFPRAFKQALVLPVYKGVGEKTCANNYRPISILSVFSKILEKILNRRLLDYLEKENILSDNQYGFRKSKSTEHAVRRLSETVSKALDKRKKCIGIFLDLKKAFDSVSIPSLLNKLEHVGVRGLVLKMFSDYLTDRTQCTKIIDVISETTQLSYGVPQGSVLGPTLFLVYINQLCQLSYPGSSVITYADDTVIIVEDKTWQDVQTKAEEILKLITTWFANNLLTLNLSKTSYVTFASNLNAVPPLGSISVKAHSCVNIGACTCAPLERSQLVKYLGVLVDETLSWKKQILSVKTRTRKLIYVFKLLRNSANAAVLKKVYFALAQSILSYCITAWGGAPKSTLLPLERAQRAVIKVINRKPFRYPTEQLYAEYRVLTVRQLFVQKAILCTHSTLVYDPATLSLNRRKDLVCKVTVHRTARAAQQCYVLGPRLYNKASKYIDLYPKGNFDCKKVLTSWLLGQKYDETENLLLVHV